MLKLVNSVPDAVDDAESGTSAVLLDLDELCRLAAQQMLARALLAERQAYLDAHADALDETGRRLVVANGVRPLP